MNHFYRCLHFFSILRFISEWDSVKLYTWPFDAIPLHYYELYVFIWNFYKTGQVRVALLYDKFRTVIYENDKKIIYGSPVKYLFYSMFGYLLL